MIGFVLIATVVLAAGAIVWALVGAAYGKGGE